MGCERAWYGAVGICFGPHDERVLELASLFQHLLPVFEQPLVRVDFPDLLVHG